MEWVWISLLVGIAFIGVLGSFLPIIPGASLIFLAALIHKISLSDGLSWWTVIILLVGTGFSLFLDYLAGAVGSRVFGASAWAFGGAAVGALVGFFFGLPGLLLGPLVGAFVGELVIARRGWKGASRAVAGVGLGVVGNFFIQLGLALVMFFLYVGDVFIW